MILILQIAGGVVLGVLLLIVLVVAWNVIGEARADGYIRKVVEQKRREGYEWQDGEGWVKTRTPDKEPEAVTPSASGSVGSVPRRSSESTKFKWTCKHCGQDHWYKHRARPPLCPACNTSFDK